MHISESEYFIESDGKLRQMHFYWFELNKNMIVNVYYVTNGWQWKNVRAYYRSEPIGETKASNRRMLKIQEYKKMNIVW